MSIRTPRCGRPMDRREPEGWPPVLEDPVCGRPEGHNPPCRSAEAVARKYRSDQARLARIRRVRGDRYGRPSLTREAA